MDDFRFLSCFKSRCYILPLQIFNTSNFFVSELNYHVLVCIFSQNVRNILVTRLFWFAKTFCSCHSSVLHAKHWKLMPWRSYFIWWLYSYDITNAHWCVKNKIKRKFTLLHNCENTDDFITLDENIYSIHNKRVNILIYFEVWYFFFASMKYILIFFLCFNEI